MSSVLIEPTLWEPSSGSSTSSRSVTSGARPFVDLRGVQWRIGLGILPSSSSSSSSSVDDLRRVTANCRRRYASLRRNLLIDPHVPKDGSNSPELVMDNPLSQNPDSMWGRFFRNAELERMVGQDLSRLYPEHGSYFQTPGCQGMLRRILLIWCLRHPEYGYGQGMHELLAPLLYVLHVDVEHLSEVRKVYEDHFIDKFDGFSFHESDLTYKFDFKKFSASMDDENGPRRSPLNINGLSEIDTKIQTVVLLSDAYGAEGELGIVVSEKFIEHDAYCMFDALMNGAGGAVAMAEFFSHSHRSSSQNGFFPVIEASLALYHLLSLVDPSLHSHLVELGVEPQYFALRWLRVLFGREFDLEDLLIIWDEIFASDNSKLNGCNEDDAASNFSVLHSERGAYVSAFAVSMILHLRSSLLATENPTTCLQRLLSFPDDVNLNKLIAKAKSLHALALDANNATPLQTHIGAYDRSKAVVVRGHSLSSDCVSPRTPLSLVPDSYWEERWRVLHKEEEHKQFSTEKKAPKWVKGLSEKVKFRLSRTESDPSSSKLDSRKSNPKPSVRRSLLEDLARQLGSEEDEDQRVCNEDADQRGEVEADAQQDVGKNPCFGQENVVNNIICITDERSLDGIAGSENSFISSDPSTPTSGGNDQEIDSERSSVASNLSTDEIDVVEPSNIEAHNSMTEGPPLPVSDFPGDCNASHGQNGDSLTKSAAGSKERKSNKFQWFWKFGRSPAEGTSEKGGVERTKSTHTVCSQNNVAACATSDMNSSNSLVSKGDTADQNVMISLRNLGQSMLENVQVLESVFQQDRGQTAALENLSKNALVGRGQTTAMAALKELRKISNLLSEM